MSPYDERNPVTSNNDDWIYFSTNIGGTFDIYKMQKNGENYQEILTDDQKNFNTFSVSYDGKLLVSPRYADHEGDIIVYDLITKSIVHEIEPALD